MKTRKSKTKNILNRLKPVGPMQVNGDDSDQRGTVLVLMVSQNDIQACINLLEEEATIKDMPGKIRKLNPVLVQIVRAWLLRPAANS